MRYVIEFDGVDDCRRCPYAHKEGEWFCLHPKADYSDKMLDEEYASDTNELRVVRPDWCPLVPYEEMVVSEWVDSVNSQPFSDEPRETIRVELYKSENEKLGAMSIANGLSVAQMVARLIDEHKVAKPYINHGNHGPEPRFPGDAWTAWHCCGNCDSPVSIGDVYCKSCGTKLDWSDNA